MTKQNTRRVLKSSARAVARAVKRRAQVAQNVYEDEEYLFALIVKKDYNDDTKCKNGLEGYCKNLEDSKLDPKEIHGKLGDLCGNKKQNEKCTKLKTNVQEKCTSLKNELGKILKNGGSTLTDKECKENEQKCLFLEAACETELKDKCIELRIGCYQKKREEVADEALMRALNGDLKEEGLCKAKIKNVCLKLGHESDELLKKCTDTDKTCTSLLKTAQDKCNSLKEEVEKAIKPDNDLQKNGHSLLEKCHFYGENCENKESKCNELKEKCKEKEIVYVPPGSHFDPTRPEPTLAEKIGLGQLYEEAAADGVVISKPLELDISDLLVFLSEKTPFDENQCKKVFKNKCNTFKHLAGNLKELCDNSTKYEDECKEFKKEFDRKKRTLTAKFNGEQFKNIIMAWSELPKVFNEYDCTVLQSECFYYEGQSFEKQCKNVRAACYKRGRNALANEALQKKLRGWFGNQVGEFSEEFYKKLLKACLDLKNESKELFALCMQPIETSIVLLTDLHVKTTILHDHLNMKRDLPTKEDCRELLKKCEDLRPDSEEIEWPCRTLKHHCAQLSVAEQLEEKLLAEKVGDLDNFDSCVENLRGQCNTWSRRWRTGFSLACVTPNVTCRYVAGSVTSKCKTLKNHIEVKGIIGKAGKENEMEDTCEFWEPYCNKYMSSCKDLKSTGKEDGCEKLKEKCKPYREQRDREDVLMSEFKGHLDTKDNCKTNLNKYCTEWDKAKNETLKGFCSSTDAAKKKDNAIDRDELCKKLVERVQGRCEGLQKRLEDAKKELEEQKTKYEGAKIKAGEAIKTANLVLLGVRATDEKAASGTKDAKQFKLMRRDTKVEVTENELRAFDLTAQAFSLYLELKEKCYNLKDECKFKKECKSEDLCKKIDGICLKLEPLDVKHETKIVTNITTTITETVGPEGKTIEELCKSIKTTDTWITRTSTHTSTSTSTSTFTSTVTLTSTRRCKPTKCTTGDEAGDVHPSGGLKMAGWSVMRGVLLGMVISVMI
ncbi:hypothetical protein PMAC_003200 [Pneumocystis sp. 'macacae']|nr:hypothetical protein PMAC_003200 [Pneumocystis sp. 'macacae']